MKNVMQANETTALPNSGITEELTTDSTEDRHLTVMDAVIYCIKQYGVKKTTMDDIAKASGVSRITLYRDYGNRNNLLSGVYAYRAQKFHNKIKSDMTQYTSIGDALEDYFVATCKAALIDRSIREMVASRKVYSDVLGTASAHSPIRDAIADIWNPLLDGLLVENATAKTIDRAEVIDWIIITQTYLVEISIEASYTTEQIRKLVAQFVSPAFLITR